MKKHIGNLPRLEVEMKIEFQILKSSILKEIIIFFGTARHTIN